MKINGYEYSKNEVLEALRKKGYTIVDFDTWSEQPRHGSSFYKSYFTIECAIKDKEFPSDDNAWYLVAKHEFEQTENKPPLI